MATDSGRAFAIKPKFLARFRADSDKTFATARVGQTHNFRCGTRHVVRVVSSDVAHQHHLGQAPALTLGGVPHGLEVTVVEMLQASQHGVGALVLCKHEVFDFNNAGHRVFGVTKKLQAHGARVLWHAVQDPTCTGDQTIAAFFLYARQATQKLVSDVFAQTYFAKALSWDVQTLLSNRRFAIRLEIVQIKTCNICVVDLAQVVPNAGHLQPLRVGCDHAPTGEVV